MNIRLKFNENFGKTLKNLNEKYGKKFEIMNGISNSHLNFIDYIENFLESKTVADSTIDANANSSTRDVRTLLSDMVKPHTKLISFNKIFTKTEEKYGLDLAKKWLEEEWNGSFYLHDASSSAFVPYCYAYDLESVVKRGLFFINKFKTEAPKHLTTFNDHVLEFISWASNRTSGAVGLPSYLVYSYYFWQKDVSNNFFFKDPEYYRQQCFQKFIYDLNQPYLRVTECAFSNISIMDRNYLTELFGDRMFPDGEYIIDHIDGIIEHQKIFMQVISEIREKTMMTFPVLTFSLLFQNGKFVDQEFARWCNRHNMKWFDSNFYVGDDVTKLSSCCRLVSDTSKLNAFINSIGGTSLSVGSVKVNTINLRRIAIESKKDMEKYIEILKDRLDTCIKILDVIRSIIVENIENDLLPNYTHGLIELDKQYNTIGITAMYETISEFDLIETD
ncbi:MAG: anaerobic ribonucleoside-triphosphate reductase, partial [Firmicutes bacterium]|nr:anaerobic ribonucleoside-triphosphate reductase [Bacillota bacterium]